MRNEKKDEEMPAGGAENRDSGDRWGVARNVGCCKFLREDEPRWISPRR